MNKREARAEACWRAGKWLISDLDSGGEAAGENATEEDADKVGAEIRAIAARLLARADELGFNYAATERLRATIRWR